VRPDGNPDAGAPVLDPAGPAHEVVRSLSCEDFGARAMRVAPGGRLIPSV
jgi:hypothetical protein